MLGLVPWLSAANFFILLISLRRPLFILISSWFIGPPIPFARAFFEFQPPTPAWVLGAYFELALSAGCSMTNSPACTL